MIEDFNRYLGPLETYLQDLSLDTITVFEIGALIFIGAFINFLSNVLIERAVARKGGDKHASKTAKRLSAYVIFSLVFVMILGVLGVPSTALGTVVGLIGLGVSFALRDIIANFISGILIMVNRPFKIGDQINVEGEEGTVRDIQIRASEVETYDGRKLIVPNSQLYTETVINNTAYNKRRFDVVVGIGYDEDIRTAKEIAEEVLQDAEHVEENPQYQVLVDQLDDSSVNLKLRGWTNPNRASMVKASSEVSQKVKDRFDKEGIDIPFPIRTVNLNEQ